MQAQPGLSPATRTFLHSELGRTHLARRAYRDAQREFLAGLALEPESPILNNNLGALLVEEGRATEAVPWLERALRLRPGYADAQRNLEAARRAAAAGPPVAAGRRP
jgi:predicted Zn-dependent protease